MPAEEERKYDVDSSFKLPDLSTVVASVDAKPPKTLTATYYDTDDLRLARSGASLRYRVGDDLPWTVKLATDVPGVRQEISLAGKPRQIPDELAWLVASLTRGAALAPVAVLRSRRRRYDLCDSHGVVLAEVADDRVSTPTRRFREIEVERKEGPSELLSTVEGELLAAGARPGAFTSKLARALGEPAALPPDVMPPSGDEATTAGEVITEAVRRGVKRLLDHDPLVRLSDRLPNGDTPVHQMRVGCRRLRSDLKTFGGALNRKWAKPLRDELGWLADLLGAARDIEVLRMRLRHTATADPLTMMDTAAVDRIDAALAQREQAALGSLAEAMRSNRYLALLESLVQATQQIPLTKRAARPAGSLADDVEEPSELAQPRENGPDTEWHQLRIQVKRARYAAEALRGRKDPLAKTLARLQDLLGEHQDAAVAADTWLSFAGDPALAVTAGRLYERERMAIRQLRSAVPAVWRELG
ncbi:MAG TPA: CHAD domain containing protein [Micromonosporaceae bacterium]|nr:CHAD domain containing protein [Micromonosporaceae bacterium]